MIMNSSQTLLEVGGVDLGVTVLLIMSSNAWHVFLLSSDLRAVSDTLVIGVHGSVFANIAS